MGVCCGNNLEYPEIEEAPSIKALSDFFKEKRKDLPLEAKEIEDYLADKSNIPRKVDISYQTDENLQKRIQYLEHYGGVVDQVTEILDNNPNMNLDKAKAIVNELYKISALDLLSKISVHNPNRFVTTHIDIDQHSTDRKSVV